MSVLLFGTVRSFSKADFLASVEVTGYQTVLEDVPVAYSVREDLCAAGVRCVLVLDDAMTPSSAVVLALMGGRPGADPRFDPVLGHRHTGLLGDGPVLS